MEKPQSLPHVTFIIPTLNAEIVLERCLNAIRSQDYPKEKIEIIVADGGSTDNTVNIAKKYNARVISNPEILHEQGKSIASRKATGQLLFYTDADNVLTTRDWLLLMVKPYVDNNEVKGFLPQTVPAPDSNALDRYLGYLFTDPFSWFVYGAGANPKDYESIYTPIQKTKNYCLYSFPIDNLPLFGLSQGVGVSKTFTRGSFAHADDLLAGIKLIQEGGLVAYVPQAGVYHYHVSGLSNFLSKYRWRIRNNLTQKIKGMGITNRTKYFDRSKKFRMTLFIPYALSFIVPFIDGVKLSIKNRDVVLMLHPFVCLILGYTIILEYIMFFTKKNSNVGVYK